MNLKSTRYFLHRVIEFILPSFIKERFRLIKGIKQEIKDLKTIQHVQCNANNLRMKSELALIEIFNSSQIQTGWSNSRKEIEQYAIPDGTGGVNPGDRKAIYFLISKLEPLSVLEIGTHIGASTIHIASALHMNQVRTGNTASLTSVDIRDVNSPVNKPWMKYGTSRSPREMIEAINCGSTVEFITDTSLNYAANCRRKFDFIFLDGDHTAKTVYQEILVSLDLLNQNGVILLHDYFPNMLPLWSDRTMIPGPFLATKRLRKEGANLTVLPLGKLPWSTKLGSNITSLALLLRNP